MKSETQLAKLIEVTDQKARYDIQVKKLLANEAILAWILKTCTEEFASCPVEEIIPCIEGEPEIAWRAVHSEDRDAREKPKSGMREQERMLNSDRTIIGANTEDGSLKEPTVYYDIRLNVCVPGNNRTVHLIINIEAQQDAGPGYPIEKRAIYYCSRLISAQYGTVFRHSEYGNLRKVYSIWFCTDPAAGRQNTIRKLAMEESYLYGKGRTFRENVDLLQVVIVSLGDPEEAADSPILRLMNVLLSSDTGTDEKRRVLQEEFHIAMTTELEQEVSKLGSLSDRIYDKGVEEGMKEGMKEGRREGLDQGIGGAVELLRESGLEDQAILEKIMRKYHLTPEIAERYISA